ncbi:MAG: M3 family metallopeptidase, partial [Verrucomicrobiota bacterium]
MSETSRPFLDPGFHIKWSHLAPEAVVADIREALSTAQANIDQLCASPSGDLSFENTLLALEESTEELTRAWGLVNHLDAVRNSEPLREALSEVLPEVTQFYSRITFNEPLWERIKSYHETTEAAALTGVRKRFVEETIRDFRRSGADLPADKKQQLEQVQSQLAEVTQKFSENVLDSTNAWELILEDDSRLSGVPETALSILISEAASKGLGSEDNPVYRISLKFPVFYPILEHADDAELRREVWQASVNIGRSDEHNNSALISQILRLRQQKAELLGKTHFADQVLEERMAKDGATALSFVEDLANRTRPFFEKEIETLRRFRENEDPGWDGNFQPWDVAYWSEKLRQAEYNFDEEALRPYFAIDRVIEGMFRLTEQVFGFAIVERPTAFAEPGAPLPAEISEDAVEVWHPEVKFYELRDAESGKHLGSFYADWHPREDKRGGAWM